MVKFEVGQCYYTKIVCFPNQIYPFLVVKRTEKTITLQGRYGKSFRLKLWEHSDSEYCTPIKCGRSSLTPVLCADSILPGEGQDLEKRAELLECADK